MRSARPCARAAAVPLQPGELGQRAADDAAHAVRAVERRIRVLEDDLQRLDGLGRPVGQQAAPGSARRAGSAAGIGRGRGPAGPWRRSTCRCPTRRRGPGSRRATSVSVDVLAAPAVQPPLPKVLARRSHVRAAAVAAVDAPSRPRARPAWRAADAGAALGIVAARLSAAADPPGAAGARCGSARRPARSAAAKAQPRITSPGDGRKPGMRVEPALVLALPAPRQAAQQGHRVGMARGVEDLLASRPPRPACRRRARRPGRTSSRRRRGCG